MPNVIRGAKYSGKLDVGDARRLFDELAADEHRSNFAAILRISTERIKERKPGGPPFELVAAFYGIEALDALLDHIFWHITLGLTIVLMLTGWALISRRINLPRALESDEIRRDAVSALDKLCVLHDGQLKLDHFDIARLRKLLRPLEQRPTNLVFLANQPPIEVPLPDL